MDNTVPHLKIDVELGPPRQQVVLRRQSNTETTQLLPLLRPRLARQASGKPAPDFLPDLVYAIQPLGKNVSNDVDHELALDKPLKDCCMSKTQIYDDAIPVLLP